MTAALALLDIKCKVYILAINSILQFWQESTAVSFLVSSPVLAYYSPWAKTSILALSVENRVAIVVNFGEFGNCHHVIAATITLVIFIYLKSSFKLFSPIFTDVYRTP